ncbi:MAG: hypothetical protein JST00_01865 [Deltaproteobacteria bacterium]|nr:hypothetical protein [Deltaproteobacteria bacterium]
MATDETKTEETKGDDAKADASEASSQATSARHREGEDEEEGSFVSSAIVIGLALAAAIGFLSLTR